MIARLNSKNELDVYLFLEDYRDFFEEFYITLNKRRTFLKGNCSLIKKILKTQEVYGLWEKGLQGVFLVFREKGFRPYLKILGRNKKIVSNLLQYFLWKFATIEVYCKLKKKNPITKIILHKAFRQVGDRGNELLLCKYAIKNYKPLIAKDEYINYEALYYKRIK